MAIQENRKVRVGVIGFSQGFYATTYTRHLTKLKNVEVVACCDLGETEEYTVECAGIDAKTFTDEIGCKLVHKTKDLYVLGIDAVLVFSEVSSHVDFAEEALEHNCHVFVGKPLTFNPDEVRTLMECANNKGKIVLSGNPLRYENSIENIARKINQGHIGKPTNIRIFINHVAMIHQEWERNPSKSGGPLGTFGVYLIDILRWITGDELKDITAIGNNFVFKQINSWDNIQAIGKTNRDALVNLNLVSSIKIDDPFFIIDVVGTEGVIRSNQHAFAYMLQSTETKIGQTTYTPMGILESEHFIDCCLGNDNPKMTLADMLEAAKGIQAIEQSIKSGKKEFVNNY